MKKYSLSLLLASSFVVMGFTMPGCPADQKMQQQLDGVTQSAAEMSRKEAALDGRVKGLEGDMGQVKQLLTQMTSTIQAQKEALDKFDAAFKNLESQMQAKKGPAKAVPKKKGR